MATVLPFAVVPYVNASGSTSWRVTGSWKEERIRKNFAERAKAESFCNEKNREALAVQQAAPVFGVVQTRLSPAQVAEAEACLHRIGGRWSLRDVVDAGIDVLAHRAPPAKVGALAEEWLSLIETEVSPRWHKDLRHRVRAFAAANPALTTHGIDRQVVRAWLDGLDGAQQTKANMRNAVHRFGTWLVERGHCRENPAAGIRITRRHSGALQDEKEAPSVFSPRQAEALLRACELGACRRLLGWMAACLFVGLRPESEAPRATWAELNLDAGEWSVMGRKRGAKPRIVPLQPAAVAWLRVVKVDAMEKPALYSRRTKDNAIVLANAWLAANHPSEKLIVWDEDITRHTFASHRAPQVPVHKLAEEMGTSAGMIYGHYRHPRTAAEVAAFWRLRPASWRA